MHGRKPNIGVGTGEGAPPCPAWLDEDSRCEWARIVPKLDRKHWLDPVDMALLAGLCVAYANWRRAEIKVREIGQVYEDSRGNWKRNPAVAVSLQYLQELRRIAAEFGLSPVARKRLEADGDLGDDDEFFGTGSMDSDQE